MIPYSRQWIDEDDIEAVSEVLRSDYLTTGEMVEKFEQAVADYCGVKYAVAVCNGTAGLHLACKVLELKGHVYTTPLTFVATTNAIVRCGARPVFVDIDETLNIKPGDRAVSVDFAGLPAGTSMIEDACHALGAEIDGEKVGSQSLMTVFSFHPVKAITTGEGGMVVTNSESLYERLKLLRHSGIVSDGISYSVEEMGYNYRLTDFQCALGISQLKKLDYFINRRRRIAHIYNEEFKGTLEIPPDKPNCKHAYHLYVVQVDNREKVFYNLREKGLGVTIHYPLLHLQPCFKDLGYKYGDFPNAERYAERCLSLPIYPKMTDLDIEYVIESVRDELRSSHSKTVEYKEVQ